MAQTQSEYAAPGWFVPPGEGGSLVVVVILLLIGALYGILYLYAAFDRWAEKQARRSPRQFQLF